MNSSYTGPLNSYNSLQDEHLAEYFSNPNRFRHLRRMGLVTGDGRIVSEGTARRNVARKELESRTKDLLADVIVSNALEIERKRRAELTKKLEFLAKIELVEKVKSEKSHPAGIQEFNPYSHHPISSSPPRLSATFNSHSNKLRLSPNQIHGMRRLVGEITKSRGIQHTKKSPYRSYLFSRSSTPVKLAPRPPSAPRPNTTMQMGQRRLKLTHQNGRPKTAPTGAHRTHTFYPRRSQPARSDVQITLCYTGRGLNLESSMDPGSSEVLILQQHCGGNTVQLYKGRVRPREHFTFGSKRHLDMPFGMTVYLDGMSNLRISACCEYRHKCGKLLGSKSSHFRLIQVKGGMPCYRCIAERERLDKKERRQNMLEDAVQSSPSAKEEERLDELLKRNGITDNTENNFSSDTPHAQSEILHVQQESSSNYSHSATYSIHEVDSSASHSRVHVSTSTGIGGPEVHDIEIQAIEEYTCKEDRGDRSCSHSEYSVDEEEIARTDSQSSTDTQQSSSTEGPSSIVSLQSKLSKHSRSSSNSSSTLSVKNENQKHPTLASEHSSSKAENDLTLNDSVEREDYDYNDDDFEKLDEGDPGQINGANAADSIPGDFSNMGSQTGDGAADKSTSEPTEVNLVTQDPSHAKSHTNVPDKDLSLSEQIASSSLSLIPSESTPNVTDQIDLPYPSNSESDQPTSIISQNTSPTTQVTGPPELDQIAQDCGSPSVSVSVHALSPSLTLEDATMVLQKTPSTTSLGSILSDKASDCASSVILSEFEADDQDVDIPNLEKKISALSDEHSVLTASPSHSEHETILPGEILEQHGASKIEEIGSVELGHNAGQEGNVGSESTSLKVQESMANDSGDEQCEENSISSALSSTALSENNDSTNSPILSEINIPQSSTELLSNYRDVEKSPSLTSVSEGTESTPSTQ